MTKVRGKWFQPRGKCTRRPWTTPTSGPTSNENHIAPVSRLRHTNGEPKRAIIRTHIKAPSFLLPRVLFLMPGMCWAYLKVRAMKNVKPYVFSGDAFSLRTGGLTGITSCWIVRSWWWCGGTRRFLAPISLRHYHGRNDSKEGLV